MSKRNAARIRERNIRKQINVINIKLQNRKYYLNNLPEEEIALAVKYEHPSDKVNNISRNITRYQSELIYLMKELMKIDGDYKPPETI